MASTFTGTARALTANGIAASLDRLGVDAATLWALLTVETSGCGYLPDRRPQILYERHLFHRLTNGAFDDGDISAAEAGGYGPSGAPQYDRLARAVQLDRAAAIKSTSWGLGQILGLNSAAAGHASADDMVDAMTASEDGQLAAVASFIVSEQIQGALQRRDWAAYASRYNGPSYQKNQYDTRLAAAYQKYTAGSMPDLGIRAAQLYLTYLGFHPGPVDGVAGAQTRSAIARYQSGHGLAATGIVDDALAARLESDAQGGS